MPLMHLAYVPCIGLPEIGTAYGKLSAWAGPLGLLHSDAKMITVFQDSFRDTDANKVRMRASLLLQEPVGSGEGVIVTTFEPGKCIVGRFEIGMDAFAASWTGLFEWMNAHGYKKSAQDPFEIYYNNPKDDPNNKFVVDMCIPVV